MGGAADCVEVAPIIADREVLRPADGVAGDREEKSKFAVPVDAVSRNGCVAGVGGEGESPVFAQDHPASCGLAVRDRTVDERDRAIVRDLVGREVAAGRLGDDGMVATVDGEAERGRSSAAGGDAGAGDAVLIDREVDNLIGVFDGDDEVVAVGVEADLPGRGARGERLDRAGNRLKLAAFDAE